MLLRLFAACTLVHSCPVAKAQPEPLHRLVNPFIGTGGHGHTFPGACVPNGLVQLSPDTRPDGHNDWDGCSGYHYSDSLIYGFSHTHLSGTGVADLCDVLVMPMSGTWSLDPEAYRSPFRKETEQAHVGYYRVMLDAPAIAVELTASARVGVHRYRYPAGKAAFVVVDLEHRDHTEQTSIMRMNAQEVVGERRSSSWAADQRLFYCMRFSHPLLEEGGNDLAEQIAAANRSKGVLAFGDLKGEPLIVKVGISAVSIEGARKNLEAEVPHWDFERVRREAEAAWEAKLGRLRVQGGTREQQRIFYTALYHSYIAPYIFNDVDGQYRGMDGQVHHADHPIYTVFSLWDTFRALHPLMTLLEPEMTNDWVRTMLLHHAQAGRLPVWELWGNETDCMIGYHSVSVIADAWAKGIRGFDAQQALRAMVHSAELEHFGLGAYQRRGFISSEDEPESVSKTLEYAYNDWCIAQLAGALGEREIERRFLARSRQWQNLYDPKTGFLRARRNGGFVEPFDPYEVNFHFTEANAWQYAFFMPHDMEHYTALAGGPDMLTRRLDALFNADTRTTGRDQSDITGLIGQYAHGNEPSHHVAYLYNRSSRPSSTEVWVSRIMNELYHDAPDGLSGNEDCGQMSAWYVLSALGFYPIAPGAPEYSTGIPLFEKVSITLPNGRPLRITAEAEAGSRNHVVDVQWNGHELDRFRTLDHQHLAEGGHLHFLLGPRPGSAPVPHHPEEDPFLLPRMVPVPIVLSDGPTFKVAASVDLACSDVDATIEYRVDDGPWKAHNGPIALERTATVEARAHRSVPNDGGGGLHSKPAKARFTQVDGERSIALQSVYAPQYAAGGDQALVDGLRGGTDFRTGEWQGFQGQDIVAVVDLGRPMHVERLGLGVLQDERSWIFYPGEVEFNTSLNQRQWSSHKAVHDVPRTASGAMTMDLWTPPIRARVRYVAITARNAGPNPDWHPGKGGATWLFADEVLVDTGAEPIVPVPGRPGTRWRLRIGGARLSAPR